MTVAHSAKARWVIDDPKEKTTGRLVLCQGCDLLYFEHGFSPSELTTMYAGYRGAEYFKRRNKYEPWYTKKVNDGIGHSSQVLQLRRDHLEKMMMKVIEEGRVIAPKRILDVGGDEGQFIPDLPSVEERAVLEVSGVRPVPDVTSITDWTQAAVFQPDMLMMCHVLEHTDTARAMIDEASKLLSSGQLFYVEVPLDRPRNIGRIFRTKMYRSYTRWLAGHPFMFRMADLLSLVSRRFTGRPFPGSVIKQNEHLNYFNIESLTKVLSANGFTEVEKSIYKPSSGVPILDVAAIGVLYQRI